jgi:uncharacterized protein YraI
MIASEPARSKSMATTMVAMGSGPKPSYF